MATKKDYEKIIEQIDSCNYECEAGALAFNAAWIELKQIVSDMPSEEINV